MRHRIANSSTGHQDDLKQGVVLGNKVFPEPA